MPGTDFDPLSQELSRNGYTLSGCASKIWKTTRKSILHRLPFDLQPAQRFFVAFERFLKFARHTQLVGEFLHDTGWSGLPLVYHSCQAVVFKMGGVGFINEA